MKQRLVTREIFSLIATLINEATTRDTRDIFSYSYAHKWTIFLTKTNIMENIFSYSYAHKWTRFARPYSPAFGLAEPNRPNRILIYTNHFRDRNTGKKKGGKGGGVVMWNMKFVFDHKFICIKYFKFISLTVCCLIFMTINNNNNYNSTLPYSTIPQEEISL